MKSKLTLSPHVILHTILEIADSFLLGNLIFEDLVIESFECDQHVSFLRLFVPDWEPAGRDAGTLW